ncbi:hypothetical protein M758_UG156600 [Ceratodon purpureus]|nr:hypothetical protein M758_UG156600 [Ceratodon purpureus]
MVGVGFGWWGGRNAISGRLPLRQWQLTDKPDLREMRSWRRWSFVISSIWSLNFFSLLTLFSLLHFISRFY